jgi:hypothetical protein
VPDGLRFGRATGCLELWTVEPFRWSCFVTWRSGLRLPESAFSARSVGCSRATRLPTSALVVRLTESISNDYRPHPQANHEQIAAALERRNSGESTIKLARELDISTQALYRRFKLLREQATPCPTS